MDIIFDEAEQHLLKYVEHVKEHAGEYFVLFFHLSKLSPAHKTDYSIKIGLNVVNDFFKDKNGKIFLLANRDLVIFYRGNDKALLDKMIFQLRYFFSDDKLAFSSEGVENHDFCTTYSLDINWRNFVYDVKNVLADNAISAVEIKVDVNSIDEFSPKVVHQRVQDIELRHFIRRQKICAIKPEAKITKLFEEIYVSINHLCEHLGFMLNFQTSKYQFWQMTEFLDAKLLTLVQNKVVDFTKIPVSLNLNVATILGDNFIHFTSFLKNHADVSVVIEINIADVFGDINAFMTAKEFLHNQGYKICLDGLNNLSITQVDRESLGFDLAKLQWNSDSHHELGKADNQRLIKAINDFGPNRVILCRCDNQEAITYGHTLGINMFQGWLIDELAKHL